jgi:hypothetical protein
MASELSHAFTQSDWSPAHIGYEIVRVGHPMRPGVYFGGVDTETVVVFIGSQWATSATHDQDTTDKGKMRLLGVLPKATKP